MQSRRIAAFLVEATQVSVTAHTQLVIGINTRVIHTGRVCGVLVVSHRCDHGSHGCTSARGSQLDTVTKIGHTGVLE